MHLQLQRPFGCEPTKFADPEQLQSNCQWLLSIVSSLSFRVQRHLTHPDRTFFGGKSAIYKHFCLSNHSCRFRLKLGHSKHHPYFFPQHSDVGKRSVVKSHRPAGQERCSPSWWSNDHSDCCRDDYHHTCRPLRLSSGYL